MVRLGVEVAKLVKFPQTFQFQYGAIGSPEGTTEPEEFKYISIPVWCDWEYPVG